MALAISLIPVCSEALFPETVRLWRYSEKPVQFSLGNRTSLNGQTLGQAITRKDSPVEVVKFDRPTIYLRSQVDLHPALARR
jgi:hypothetical protein